MNDLLRRINRATRNLNIVDENIGHDPQCAAILAVADTNLLVAEALAHQNILTEKIAQSQGINVSEEDLAIDEDTDTDYDQGH